MTGPHSQLGDATSDRDVVLPFPGPPSDAVLVGALKAHRPQAAELLFQRYGRYVERLVVRVLGLDPEVPDLINEVFARALERIDVIEEPAALKGWLGSIALFTAKTFLRDRSSRRRFVSFFAPEELPEIAGSDAPADVSLALFRAYRVLDKFPADERIAFALRFMDGMSLGEIAELTGLSLGTVKRRLTRAQQRFFSAAERDPLLRERIQPGQRRNPP